MGIGAGQTLRDTDLARITALETPPRAEIRRVASLTVATGTAFVAVTLDDDGGGVRDPLGMWSASPNPTRITLPNGYDGRWAWWAELQWDFNATGSRAACFTKNATTPSSANARLGQDGRRASDATETACRPSVEDNFVGGDYMQLWLSQNSGVTLGVGGAASTAVGIRVYARRLGPAL